MYDNQRQTHWAYIAGVMDSDGCFMISRHKRKTKNGTTERALAFPKSVEAWSYTYMPMVKVSQVETEAVHFLRDEMKFGSISTYGARPSRPNSQPIHQWWMVKKENIIPFIEGILPYLRIKKDRAKFLLEYCKHLVEVGNPCYSGLTTEELNYRDHSYRKMREFNGNKVAATTKSSKRESASDSLIL